MYFWPTVTHLVVSLFSSPPTRSRARVQSLVRLTFARLYHLASSLRTLHAYFSPVTRYAMSLRARATRSVALPHLYRRQSARRNGRAKLNRERGREREEILDLLYMCPSPRRERFVENLLRLCHLVYSIHTLFTSLCGDTSSLSPTTSRRYYIRYASLDL